MTKYVEDNEEIWKKEGEDLFESEKTTLELGRSCLPPKRKEILKNVRLIKVKNLQGKISQ